MSHLVGNPEDRFSRDMACMYLTDQGGSLIHFGAGSATEMSSHYIRHVTRKPVFGICDQVKLKPACSATVTS